VGAGGEEAGVGPRSIHRQRIGRCKRELEGEDGVGSRWGKVGSGCGLAGVEAIVVGGRRRAGVVPLRVLEGRVVVSGVVEGGSGVGARGAGGIGDHRCGGMQKGG
jgi:hypothetical protein